MPKSIKIMMIALFLGVILTLSFSAGCTIGAGTLTNTETGLEVVEEVWGIIFHDYVDRDRLDASALSKAAIKGMLEELDDLDPSVYFWIRPLDSTTQDNIRDNSFWAAANSKESVIDSNTRFMVIEEGVTEGTSLDMTKTTLHSYAIYGRRYNSANPNLGRGIVKIGYLKIN